MNFSKICLGFMTVATMLSANTAIAASFAHTDTVNRVSVITTRADASFMLLNGFTEAGNCPTLHTNGLVIARFKSDELSQNAFSMAMAAQIAGKKVRLTVDDEIRNANGYCVVQSIYLTE